jgi:hypothetical protein
MNLASIGRPRMAWYDERKSVTSNIKYSVRKFSFVSKVTSRHIRPMGYAVLPGTTRRKAHRRQSFLLKSKSILRSISVKMMFKLLPPSIRVLGRKAPSTMGLTISGYVPWLGMWTQ